MTSFATIRTNPNRTMGASPSSSIATEQAAAHYASVAEQIEELTLAVANERASIELHRESIKVCQDTIRTNLDRIAKLKKRKRIFARARFELEQVDEQ